MQAVSRYGNEEIGLDLKELRNEIDRLDTQIQQLFERRMDIVKAVAAYKKEHDLPVLHAGRENEVLDKIAAASRPEYRDGSRALFTAVMDISKCSQSQLIQNSNPYLEQSSPFVPAAAHTVACQGVLGAYSHIAARRLFQDECLHFYPHFEDVFQAVVSGAADFGVLPVENSNAGSVMDVYELLKRYNIYIARRVKIKVEHCLAALPGTNFSEIQEVYSHEQAVRQCSSFLKEHQLQTRIYSNTAASAELVAHSRPDEHLGVICSELAAQRNGLRILKRGIANIDENYTRFIVISKTPKHSQDDDLISISFSLPHTVGSLYRMLTKFYVYNINMEKIESMPIGNKNFDVMFYLDFTGNLTEQNVTALLNDLSASLPQFKYLGNYKEI